MANISLLNSMSAFLVLGLVGAHASADSIPWGYSAGNAEIFNNNNDAKTSSIVFSGSSGGATGNSGIIVYSMSTTSSASNSAADSFSNVPFDLAFTLVDVKATGSGSGSAKKSDVVHFSGLFSASNVTKNSLLPGGLPWSSPVTAQVTLGADDVGWRVYSVQLSSFTSPGQPGGSPGSIQAIVTIAPGAGPIGSGESPPPPVVEDNDPAPSAAPEPSSFLLAALGLPILGLLRRLRKPHSIV